MLGYKYILRVTLSHSVDGVCAARTPSRRRRLSSLEEHRPGLGRDDRDEAEHEVHFRAHLGDVELVFTDEGRIDGREEVEN